MKMLITLLVRTVKKLVLFCLAKRSGYTVLSLLLVDHLDLSPLYSESIKVLHLLTGISVRVFPTLARSFFETDSASRVKYLLISNQLDIPTFNTSIHVIISYTITSTHHLSV